MNPEQWEAVWDWLLEELWPHEIGDYDLAEYLRLKKAQFCENMDTNHVQSGRPDPHIPSNNGKESSD